MKSNATVTTQQAIDYAEERGVLITRVTVINWCEKYQGLAKKIGGRWYINKKRFALLIDGKTWQSEEQV